MCCVTSKCCVVGRKPDDKMLHDKHLFGKPFVTQAWLIRLHERTWGRELPVHIT